MWAMSLTAIDFGGCGGALRVCSGRQVRASRGGGGELPTWAGGVVLGLRRGLLMESGEGQVGSC